MKLYELTDTMKRITEYLDRLEEIEDDGDRAKAEEALLGMMADTKDAISEKIDDICKLVRNMNAEVDAIDEEVKRLTERKRTIMSEADRLKRYTQACMQAAEQKSIKTSLFTCTVSSNPPSLIVDNEEEVPEYYKIPQPPKIDKTAIKNDIKNGAVFSWCHLEKTESLRIK